MSGESHLIVINNCYITGEGFWKVILFFNIMIQNFNYNENNTIETDAFTLKAEELLNTWNKTKKIGVDQWSVTFTKQDRYLG